EDGIRDFHVTGVQTCALPISRWQHVKVALEGLDELMKAPVERPAARHFARKPALRGHYRLEAVSLRYADEGPAALDLKALEIREIGTASCRGRVEHWGLHASW